MKKIEGLIAATFAAYDERGAVNLEVIPAIVEQLIIDGLTGVFVCGTNGEGPSLTTEERMRVAEAYVKAANKRMLVLVHVGHSSIVEAKTLAEHAARIGADAISSVSAFYFKPNSIQSLVSCLAEIAAAAPSLPFYYYHIPHLTGLSMDMVAFLEQAEKLIPNLAGIKYTSATLHEYEACLNYKNGKFDILFGFDEMLLGALAVGAKGAIGSTYTFAAPLYRKIIEKFEQGDLQGARDLQLHAVYMVRCLVKHAPIPAQRAIVAMTGMTIGDCRLPLIRLNVEETAILQDDLEKCGFFSILKKCREELLINE
ncbi:N-acetylneuraminate lyase [Olivibacter ginsenosidimutans]|uniref:N-acetylneuraminate lyase n=1 Tax=Olivibacter ginsenosidimutans TaxID=1176537 RepID=A0ABP9BMF0_9SPHI